MIVSHRSFEFLPLSDKYFNRFVEKQLVELDAEISTVNDSKGDNRRMVKELEKAKKRLIVRLKKRADRDSKDRTMTFEEQGSPVAINRSRCRRALKHIWTSFSVIASRTEEQQSGVRHGVSLVRLLMRTVLRAGAERGYRKLPLQ